MSDTRDEASVAPLSLREAEQVSALLSRAKPVMAPQSEAALLDRIVASAERVPRLVVVSETLPPSRTPASTVLTPQRSRAVLARRAGLSGLLAASLLLGVLLGQTSVSEVAVASIEDVTGLALTTASLDLAVSDSSFED